MASHGRKYGDKESRPLPVWNGILDHCERIGCAIWEFLWCIDKVTSESDGSGIVLGGAPVKIGRIARDLGLGEHSVRRHLSDLTYGEYIRRRRTPYGFVIEVLNSRKFGVWRSNVTHGPSPLEKTVQNRPISNATLDNLTDKCGRNKEDSAVDTTGDAAGSAAPVDSYNPWRLLGSELPMGTPRFQEIAEHFLATRNGNLLSDAMERAIQAANRRGVPVPKPFFNAKRAVERRESAELTPADEDDVLELEDRPWITQEH